MHFKLHCGSYFDVWLLFNSIAGKDSPPTRGVTVHGQRSEMNPSNQQGNKDSVRVQKFVKSAVCILYFTICRAESDKSLTNKTTNTD